MLGYMANAGTMYRNNEPALVADERDLATALREAITALPEGIYRAEENTLTTQITAHPIRVPDDVKENAFTLHDGGIAIRTGATLTPTLDLPGETARRIRGLIKVRAAVREVLRTQLDDLSDEEIVDARRRITFAYD